LETEAALIDLAVKKIADATVNAGTALDSSEVYQITSSSPVAELNDCPNPDQALTDLSNEVDKDIDAINSSRKQAKFLNTDKEQFTKSCEAGGFWSPIPEFCK